MNYWLSVYLGGYLYLSIGSLLFSGKANSVKVLTIGLVFLAWPLLILYMTLATPLNVGKRLEKEEWN